MGFGRLCWHFSHLGEVGFLDPLRTFSEAAGLARQATCSGRTVDLDGRTVGGRSFVPSTSIWQA
jgi:hypothetical protein